MLLQRHSQKFTGRCPSAPHPTSRLGRGGGAPYLEPKPLPDLKMPAGFEVTSQKATCLAACNLSFVTEFQSCPEGLALAERDGKFSTPQGLQGGSR